MANNLEERVELELIFVRHPTSTSNPQNGSSGIEQGKIQGQQDVDLTPGYEPDLYDLLRELVDQEGPIVAVYTSNLKRANEPSRLARDYIKTRQEEPFESIETAYLRERARGRLEGASYVPGADGRLVITPEEGNGRPRTLRKGQTMDEFLYSLDDPNLGEDRAAIQQRIQEFRDEYLRKHEREGGRIIIFGHSHWINHAVKYLVDGDVAAGDFEPLGNLGIVRLGKNGPHGVYKRLGPYELSNSGVPNGLMRV